MGHIDLNPIGAMVELLARGVSRFDWTIDKLRTFGHIQFSGVALEGVSTGGRNSAGNNKKPRPWNHALFDGLLDLNVSIACAFGLDVAQCSKALLESVAHGNRGPSSAQAGTGAKNVGVITALGGLFAPQKNMRVRIDQTGKNGKCRKIDDLRSRRDLSGRG